MIQIRFHGRGGHGIKTASRILGTAAFLEGYEAQDSPLYGAERRGAPIVAFTRIDRQPIRMRGMIETPDIVVVADETLVAHTPGNPLDGVNRYCTVFVNTAVNHQTLRKDISVTDHVSATDVTSLVIDSFGSPRALSGAIGSIACRLSGLITQKTMRRAVTEELTSLGLTDEAVAKNADLAETCFKLVKPVVLAKNKPSPIPHEINAPIRIESHPATISAPSIYAHGNTLLRHTGTWRFKRPEIDLTRCTKCGICVLRCPDGAMALDAEGYPLIDYEQCKGCLICTMECPLHLIAAEKEVRIQ